MPIIKVVESGFKSQRDMMNLITYIISDEKHRLNGLVGGNMVFTGSEQSVFEQMMECKRYFKKANGRYMLHLVVSFSAYEMKYIDANKAYMIAMQICRFFQWYQSIFAIHQETEQLHIHIGINTVSFLDGRKMRFLLWDLKAYVNKVVNTYVPEMALFPQRKNTMVATLDELE